MSTAVLSFPDRAMQTPRIVGILVFAPLARGLLARVRGSGFLAWVAVGGLLVRVATIGGLARVASGKLLVWVAAIEAIERSDRELRWA